MMPPTEQTDLNWLAVQYICGELSETETAAFEQRLADDHAAREAVANAVQLTSAIHSAFDSLPATAVTAPAFSSTTPSVPDHTTRRQRNRILGWASSAVAVAICLTLGLQVWQAAHTSNHSVAIAPTESTAKPPSTASGTATALVAIWSKSAPAADDADGDAVHDADFWTGEAGAELAADHDVRELGSVRVPSWLIAAVSQRNSDPFDDSEQREEN